MNRTLLSLIFSSVLFGCGGSETQNAQENDVQEPDKLKAVSPFPSSPQAKPTIDFDQQLMSDIEDFVKVAYSVKYFYPSTENQDSNWPLFIAESLVDLSQTEPAQRTELGIERLRQIAPYIAFNRAQLPEINDQTTVSTWKQNAPINQSVYTRTLLTDDFSSLKNDEYSASDRFAELNYGAQTLYLPLYLPTDKQIQGYTYQEPGKWQIDNNFEQPEICMTTVSEMWASISHFWPYFKQIDVDWAQSLTPLLTACTDDDVLRKQNSLFAEFSKLNDNHISIVFPTPEEYRFKSYIPFTYELVEEKAIVTQLDSAHPNGIEVGDEVISVDGIEINNYLDNKSIYSLKNTLHRKNLSARFDVYAKHFNPVKYEIRKPNNDIHSIEVLPKDLNKREPFVGMPYVPKSDHIFEYVDDNILKINVYNVQEADITELRNELSEAKAVMLDMRRYPTSWRGWQGVLALLIKNDATNDTIAYHWQGSPNQRDAKKQVITQRIYRSENAFNIPTVALSSRHSISQNEHSFIFVQNGGLPILGETTSGINGNILRMNIFEGAEQDSGTYFVYTNMEANRRDGTPLINRGIEPDINVPRSIDSVLNQVDNQVNAAIDYLQQQLAN